MSKDLTVQPLKELTVDPLSELRTVFAEFSAWIRSETEKRRKETAETMARMERQREEYDARRAERLHAQRHMWCRRRIPRR